MRLLTDKEIAALPVGVVTDEAVLAKVRKRLLAAYPEVAYVHHPDSLKVDKLRDGSGRVNHTVTPATPTNFVTVTCNVRAED